MKSILHVLDASANWQHRVSLGQLLNKLPADQFTQSVAFIDHRARQIAIDAGVSSPIAALRHAGVAAFAAPALRRICVRDDVDIIHTWGPDAATAARAARPDGSVALTIFDPGLSARDVRVIRAVAESGVTGVVCAAERVRRRLVEQGVPFERCALIRPAVDFAVIAEAKRRPIRDELGIAKDALVVLTPPADRDAYGHAAALWSIMVRSHLPGDARLIIPGCSSTEQRLRELAARSEHPETVLFTKHRYRFEDLCTAADYLVIAATGDMPATSIAWAMASSTPIIAAADYAVAEMLSNDLNAILFKAPDRWTRIGLAICKQYLHPANLAKIKEVARGQAYEVFGLRRCIQQYTTMYENLLANKPAGENITDPAQQAA